MERHRIDQDNCFIAIAMQWYRNILGIPLLWNPPWKLSVQQVSGKHAIQFCSTSKWYGMMQQQHSPHEFSERSRLHPEIRIHETTEQQIKESEERFRSLVESSPNGIVLTDAGGMIRLVNRQTEVLFGYERNELIGKSIEILIPDRLRTNHPEYRQEFYHDPQTRPMGSGRDLYAKHKLGHEIPVEIGLTTLNHASQLMVLSTIVDITERKKNEEKLKQKNEELARYNEELKARTSQLIQSEKMSALGTLIAGVAHELNNPVTGILNYAQYCRKHMPPGDKLTEVLDDLVFEAKRCADIVNNLLTYSYWSYREPLSDEKTNIREVVKRVTRIFGHLLTDIDLRIIIPDDMPDLCIVSNKLQQVVSNLLKNAIDAISGMETQKITIQTYHESSCCFISIEDSGPGMPHEIMNRIFDPFFTTKEVGKGSGLGLSVSKSIIGEFKGEISVDSHIGKGTRFIIKLPVQYEPTN